VGAGAERSDLVAAVYAKLRGGAGHAAPDALGVRLVGANGSWIIGGGRYGLDCGGVDCYERSQSTLYPAAQSPIPNPQSPIPNPQIIQQIKIFH